MKKKNHMPPIPPANRNDEFLGSRRKLNQDRSVKHSRPLKTAEQGETANIKQDTKIVHTNAGFFHGRRVK